MNISPKLSLKVQCIWGSPVFFWQEPSQIMQILVLILCLGAALCTDYLRGSLERVLGIGFLVCLSKSDSFSCPKCPVPGAAAGVRTWPGEDLIESVIHLSCLCVLFLWAAIKAQSNGPGMNFI
jgi:hypothetical protein